MIGIGLHTRAYDAWYIYEPVAIIGIVATAAGLLAWMLRAFECDRHGFAIVLASAAAGLVCAYLGAGGRIHYLFAALACIFVLPLALVVAGIYTLMKRPRLARGFGALALAVVVQALAARGSNILREHDVAAAQAWCDDLVPGITAFHAKNDYWPPDLEAEGIASSRRPRLLRDETYYRLDKKGFVLFFRCRVPRDGTLKVEPVRWFWHSEKREWKFDGDRK